MTPRRGSREHPLPRCPHGQALCDHSGEELEPSCGCRTSNRRGHDQDFLARFYKVSDETPVDDAEALEILTDVGIDVASALKETTAHIAGVEKRQKDDRLGDDADQDPQR